VKIIGITGGIGSGKSTVCAVFSTLGIPVFDADAEAKKAYDNPLIREEVARMFGSEVFEDGQLNREKLAKLVFDRPTALAQLNALIHPEVKSRFKKWTEAHSSAPVVLREAAILFESGTNADCDETVLVTAPEGLRVLRAMVRSGMSESAVRARMANQWPDEKKMPLATHVLLNDEQLAILPQCLRLKERWMGHQ